MKLQNGYGDGGVGSAGAPAVHRQPEGHQGITKCFERRDGVAQIGGLHPFRCNVVAVGDGGRGFRGLVLQRKEVRDLREH